MTSAWKTGHCFSQWRASELAFFTLVFLAHPSFLVWLFPCPSLFTPCNLWRCTYMDIYSMWHSCGGRFFFSSLSAPPQLLFLCFLSKATGDGIGHWACWSNRPRKNVTSSIHSLACRLFHTYLLGKGMRGGQGRGGLCMATLAVVCWWLSLQSCVVLRAPCMTNFKECYHPCELSQRLWHTAERFHDCRGTVLLVFVNFGTLTFLRLYKPTVIFVRRVRSCLFGQIRT